MEPLTTDPVRRVAAERALATDAAEGPQQLGRDDFLKLLVAQLEHQDPLKPNQDKEFVAQLATFSSLEQLITANENLEGIAGGQSSLVNAQALSLIGKDALVDSVDEIRILNGKADSLVYAVPRSALSATLTISGADGTPVRVFDLEKTPGRRFELAWDGTDDEGNVLPDGNYRFDIQARDLSGDAMGVERYRSVPIDGVNFGGDSIALVSGNDEIPFDQILEIRAGQPEG